MEQDDAVDAMDDVFVRKGRPRRWKHKWLLLGLVPTVAAFAVIAVVCLVLLKEKGELGGLDVPSEVSRMVQNLDLSVDPCKDFYEFACGGFLKDTEIPDDEVEVSMFTSVQKHVLSQLRVILEEPIATGELRSFQLAKNYYKSCLDKSTIESRGLKPMKKILRQLGGWPVVKQNWSEDNFVWWKMVMKLQSMGFLADFIIHMVVDADAKNSTYRSIVLDQPSPETALELTMDIKPLMTSEQTDMAALISYQRYLVELATAFGANRYTASTEMTDVMMFYVQLAKILLPEENRRNSSESYNPMKVSELQKLYPITEWVEYLNGLLPANVNVTSDDTVIVEAPTFFHDLTALLRDTAPRVLANYIISQAVVSSVKYLSSEVRSKEQQLQLELMGTSKNTELWIECVNAVSDSLWSSVGAMYVRRFFKEETKKAAVGMVKDIRDQFVEILKTIDWMDNSTRMRGLEKAAKMVTHVGYSDEMLDNSKLDDLYKDLHLDASMYFESTLNISKFGVKLIYGRLREKVNKTEWITHSMPTVVNAFYSVVDNSIQIPAGILQSDFFNSERPWYMNYGAIGFIIGHEITHGFDDEGSQFDADSNLVDWWDPVTKQKYLNKTQCIVEQYGNFTETMSGLKLNGINTQGENIADNGGIKEAYLAYLSWVERNGEEPHVPELEFTPRQMFWIAAAQTWCSKYRPHAGRVLAQGSEHSPGKYRVIGPFSNFAAFSKDFSCPLGSPMNPLKKCSVW